MTETPVIPSLLTLTKAALEPADALFEKAKDIVRDKVCENGKVSAKLVEEEQTAAHGLAWTATYVEALRQMQRWAENLDAENAFGELEQLIHQIAFGEYLWQLSGGIPMSQSEIVRPQDIGLSRDDQRLMMTPEVVTLTQSANNQSARMRLVELMRDRTAESTFGATGLDDELEMIREQFRRFASTLR